LHNAWDNIWKIGVTIWMHHTRSSMKQSPSWEVDSCPASQIPCSLSILRVHYCVQNSHNWTISRASWIYSTPPHPSLQSISLLTPNLCLRLLSAADDVAEILYTFVFSPVHITCPTNLYLDVITQVIYVKNTNYKVPYCVIFSSSYYLSWSFLCVYFQMNVITSI
jgi:hypothetical protein